MLAVLRQPSRGTRRAGPGALSGHTTAGTRSDMIEQGDHLRHSPLEDEHRALGAKLGPFAGWLMPIEYVGTLAEHAAVREAVGVFDVTHLGKFGAEGPDASDALQV